MKNHYWDIGRSPPNTKDLLYGLNGYYSIGLGACGINPKQAFKRDFMRKRAAKRFIYYGFLGAGLSTIGYMAYKKFK